MYIYLSLSLSLSMFGQKRLSVFCASFVLAPCSSTVRKRYGYTEDFGYNDTALCEISWRHRRLSLHASTGSSERKAASCEKVLPVCAWLVLSKTGHFSAQDCM